MIFNNWKIAGVMTYGTGRPEARITGDPNRDDNSATTDCRDMVETRSLAPICDQGHASRREKLAR